MFLTVVSWSAYRFLRRQVRSYVITIYLRIFHSLLGSTQSGWVFIPIPKKGNAKECSSYCTIALISHNSKVMLKILQARLQQHLDQELPDVQAGFRKGRETRDQFANIRWIIKKKQENFRKNLLLLYWLYQSLWLCGLQQTVENSWSHGNTRPSFLTPE